TAWHTPAALSSALPLAPLLPFLRLPSAGHEVDQTPSRKLRRVGYAQVLALGNLTRSAVFITSSVMRHCWEVWTKILQTSLTRHTKPFGRHVWIEILL
ncbi:hypothetical protein JRQ81_001666, partial [Phrynocephalus forsythii]